MKAWRGHGDALYALIIVGLFLAEAVVLGALTWVVALRPTGLISAAQVERVLVAAIAATAAAVLATTMFMLGFHVFTGRRERRDEDLFARWTKRWTEVLFTGRAAPGGTLPREAVDALLSLRESLRGQEAEQVVHLIRRYRVAEHALARCAVSEQAHGPLASIVHLVLAGASRRRGLARRLESLETLARARAPESFDGMLPFVRDEEPAVRRLALRALARTLGSMAEGARRDHAAARLVEVLAVADVPEGVLEDALVLADASAEEMVRSALVTPRLPEPLLRAAIEAAGKRGAIGLAEPVAHRAGDERPEIRAAALRAMHRMGLVPPPGAPHVLAALDDDLDFVRTQAAHAVVLLGPDEAVPRLTAMLSDASWWVRRSAGQGLLDAGKRGQAALEWAARTHTDRYARQMATQILLDAGRLDPDEARRLRESA